MKLSVETYAIREKFGDFKCIEMIKKAGFDAVDYSYFDLAGENEELVLGENYRAYAEKLRDFLSEKGLFCNQSHAPFDLIENDAFDLSNEKFVRLIRSIEGASILGAENIVVHAVSTDIETNVRFYKALEPYCKKHNIKVAVENLFKVSDGCFLSKLGTPEELNAVIDLLDSPWFTICIDIGHAQLTYGSPEKFIDSVDTTKIKALHISDNNLKGDDHLLPYVGRLNWDNIALHIKNANYTGDLTFEIGHFLNRFKSEESLQKALNLSQTVGREIINLICA